MRLEKRHRQSALALVLAPVGAVAVTMLVSALLVLWAGAPVAQTYALLLQGGFGSVFALSETFTRAIPLMLTGLAATVAFQARLFNMHPTGKMNKEERVEALMGDGGLEDCGKAQNCVAVCPKEIPLTSSIATMNREVTKQMVKELFFDDDKTAAAKGPG